MGRKVTTAVEVYGPVRLHPRGARWRLVWTEHGKQHEKSAPTIEQARTDAMAIAARIIAGDTPSVDRRFAAVVVDALKPETGNRGSRTQLLYDGIARNHIIPRLGDVMCRDLKDTDVRRLLSDMAAEGYSNSLISHTLKVLKLACRQGVRDGAWTHNNHPCLDVRAPRGTGRPAELSRVPQSAVPSDDQVAAYIDAFDDELLRYRVMVRIAAGVGVRWGELIAIRTRDINFAAGTITIAQALTETPDGIEAKAPKTEAGVRVVPLPSRDQFAVSDALGELVKGRAADELIFVSRNGTPLRRSNYQKVLKRTRARSGWPEHFTWHDLRHYAATRLLRDGLPLGDVSAILGHANPAITQRLYVGGDAQTIDRAKALI